MATVPYILFSNLKHPNIKKEVSDRQTRYKKIFKLWSLLPEQERTSYLVSWFNTLVKTKNYLKNFVKFYLLPFLLHCESILKVLKLVLCKYLKNIETLLNINV